jgi:hypothetical protein
MIKNQKHCKICLVNTDISKVLLITNPSLRKRRIIGWFNKHFLIYTKIYKDWNGFTWFLNIKFLNVKPLRTQRIH